MEKIVELKNMYTGDIVYTKEYDNIVLTENVEFIKVYRLENPDRTYLVNRSAFIVQDTV